MTAHLYAVQTGDTLWSIAQRTSDASDTSAVGSYWTELVRLNRAALASTRPLTHPDTTLWLPDPQ